MNKNEVVYLACYLALVGSYVQILVDNLWKGKEFLPIWYYIIDPIVFAIILYVVLYFINKKLEPEKE